MVTNIGMLAEIISFAEPSACGHINDNKWDKLEMGSCCNFGIVILVVLFNYETIFLKIIFRDTIIADKFDSP